MAILRQLYVFYYPMINWPKTMTTQTKKLLERHPAAANNRRPPPVPSPSDICLQVSEQDVKHVVKSFSPGSAGGSDGLRPQHIADLVSCRDNSHY